MKVIGSTIAYTHLDLEGALEGLASVGFREVDLLAMSGWAHFEAADLVVRAEEEALRIGALLERTGLTAMALNAKQTGQMNSPEPSEQTENLREQSALVDFAEALGIPRITLQPGPSGAAGSHQESLALSIEAFRKVVEYAGTREVTIAFEPHANSVAETYEAMRAFLREVPGLQVTYDPSHFVKMGWEVRESEFLFERTGNVHLRDAVLGELQAPPGKGGVDFGWVVGKLKEYGYEGTASIEYFPDDGRDVIPDTLRLRELLEGLLAD